MEDMPDDFVPDTPIERIEFEHLVESVTADKSRIDDQGYQTVLPQDLKPFVIGLSRFANQTFRESVLAKGIEDEEFTFVLCNRVIVTLVPTIMRGEPSAGEIDMTQSDVDALGTLIVLSALWGQSVYAEHYYRVIGMIVEQFHLNKPSFYDEVGEINRMHLNPDELDTVRHAFKSRFTEVWV